MGDIRIGQVSNIDYNSGMVKVLYQDRDGDVTKALPYLSFNDEYKMPTVGQYVLVAHLSNGSEAGIVLGGYWNRERRPAASGEGVYRKELGSVPGKAFVLFEEGSGNLTINAEHIIFKGDGGSISLRQVLDLL